MNLYFYLKHLTPLRHFQKKFALSISESFRGIHFLKTYLLVFPVDELCNVTNKYQPSSNLAKYQQFYT